ncbi:MAG: 50S ribosomal protein L35 [Candidatus Omnitrophota bacterium]
MPKLKTKKALAKRVKVTKKRKVIRAKANRRHLLSHRSSKRKRKLRHGGLVSKADKKTILRAMPYS